MSKYTGVDLATLSDSGEFEEVDEHMQQESSGSSSNSDNSDSEDEPPKRVTTKTIYQGHHSQ